jgi:hypothetical protein
MKCMMRIYIHRPVLVVDHLAVADLEPDERGQLHRLPKHLVVLPVVDQDLNTIMHVLIIHSAVPCDGLSSVVVRSKCSKSKLVLPMDTIDLISINQAGTASSTHLGFAGPRGVLLHRVLHDPGFPKHLNERRVGDASFQRRNNISLRCNN